MECPLTEAKTQYSADYIYDYRLKRQLGRVSQRGFVTPSVPGLRRAYVPAIDPGLCLFPLPFSSSGFAKSRIVLTV
jgi:hypothetical protein